MYLEIDRSPSIRALKVDNPFFTIVNGMVVAPRASIEISKNCPDSYISIVMACIDNGWIRPVAYVTEEEYMIMQLSQ